MYSRIERMLSEEEFNKIKNINVLIVGIGGVGGYALEMLVRSGVSNITIIDSDVVDISNLNRQIIALNSNVGLSKIEVAEKRVLDINPTIKLNTKKIFLTKDNMDSNLGDYDYIIDACDTVTTKIELIKYAKRKMIKIITCMGTGNKLDPSKLEIIELSKTAYDPLAKSVRQILRKDGVNDRVMCVCSTENARKVEYRTPGSIALVPATAGILCASFVINDNCEIKK